jgi:hypothetical protein
MRNTCLTVAVALLIVAPSAAQRGQSAAAADAITILKPARVWDGDAMHEGWSVRVKGERIDAVGPESATAAAGARVIDLPGTTLTPGLVEATRTSSCTPITRHRGPIRCRARDWRCAWRARPTICDRR